VLVGAVKPMGFNFQYEAKLMAHGIDGTARSRMTMAVQGLVCGTMLHGHISRVEKTPLLSLDFRVAFASRSNSTFWSNSPAAANCEGSSHQHPERRLGVTKGPQLSSRGRALIPEAKASLLDGKLHSGKKRVQFEGIRSVPRG